MNGSKGNAAFNASEKPERRNVVLNLNTAHNMLPLVQRVVADILVHNQTVARLLPEQDRLDRHKRDLSWPERQRRYQVHHEVADAEQHVREAVSELGDLGLSLLDLVSGRVGFPTLVNDRKAFFSWRPGEDTLLSWHFAEEDAVRPIPPSWWKMADVSLSGKS